MLYKVYHAKEPTFGIGGNPVFPDEYQHVATVRCSRLEDVFRLTNHIDHDWTKNNEVEWSGGWTRSTSVGDVVIDETGETHICEVIGWQQLTT